MFFVSRFFSMFPVIAAQAVIHVFASGFRIKCGMTNEDCRGLHCRPGNDILKKYRFFLEL
jgi:hypothetical protein